MREGTISNVNMKGYGFIRSQGTDFFFHCTGIIDNNLAFDQGLVERRVEFDVIDTEKGPKAVSVRAVD